MESSSSSNVAQSSTVDDTCPILSMPSHMLTRIATYLSYEQMASARGVCKAFKQCMEHELNSGFNRLGRVVANSTMRLKRQLPKKESERRSHPFHRYAEVFAALETRYTLLTMTYKKYIDQHFCCFIPGKVLDLAFAIVNRINGYLNENKHVVVDVVNVLVEIRDYSSMAMEHFDEAIAPMFPAKPQYSFSIRQFQPLNMRTRLSEPSTPTSSTSNYEADLTDSVMSTLDARMRLRMDQQERIISEQRRKLEEQQRTIERMIKEQHRSTEKTMKEQHKRLEDQHKAFGKMVEILGEFGKSVSPSPSKTYDRINDRILELSESYLKKGKRAASFGGSQDDDASTSGLDNGQSRYSLTSGQAQHIGEDTPTSSKYNLRKRQSSILAKGQQETPVSSKKKRSN